MTTSAGTKRPLDETTASGDAASSPFTELPSPSALPTSGETQYFELPWIGEHKKAISAVAFAPTHHQSPFAGTVACASASADGTVKIWTLSDDVLAGTSEADLAAVSVGQATAAVGRGGKEAEGTLATSKDPIIRAAAAAAQAEAEAEAEAAAASEAAADQSTAAPTRLCLTPTQTLTGHARGINDVSWSPTADYVATASDDKTCRIWDVHTGDPLVEFKGHTNFVFSCRFNPQGNLLVSGSFDETVKLWDVRTGEVVSTLPAHSDPVTAVDFNRDGTTIVSGSHDGLIRIWDTMTGECLKTIYAGGNPPVSYVRFSPNGKFVLSGTLDSTLRLWKVGDKQESSDAAVAAAAGGPTGTSSALNGMMGSALGGGGARCTKTYGGGDGKGYHVNSKFCIFSAFAVGNPQKQSIVTGSEDGNVYLYDLQRRNVRQVLKGHTDAVLAVDAHDAREILVSGGMTDDRTVRFWVPRPL